MQFWHWLGKSLLQVLAIVELGIHALFQYFTQRFLLFVKHILTLAIYIHPEYGEKSLLREKQLQETKLRIMKSSVLKRDLLRAKFKNLSHQREERSLCSFKKLRQAKNCLKMCSSK
jgi:hypothetical protein